MYAVIEQGGYQYKVSQGDVIDIELADVTPDAKQLEIDKVLLVSDGREVKVGTPYLEGAKVVAAFAGTAEQSVVKGPSPEVPAGHHRGDRGLTYAHSKHGCATWIGSAPDGSAVDCA